MSLKTVRRANGQVEYTTQEGDIVDHLCWQYYGRENETTEIVLSANPGHGAQGAVLGSGIVIRFPDIAPQAETRRDSINLFD